MKDSAHGSTQYSLAVQGAVIKRILKSRLFIAQLIIQLIIQRP